MGLYQLIFPIYALCFSLTTAGIEVDSFPVRRKKSSSFQTQRSKTTFVCRAFTFPLRSLRSPQLYYRQMPLLFTIYILGDIRCEPLLIAISYSLPFASVHSCICGYYLGRKQTKIPALAQLIEQIARVFSVYVIYMIALKKEQPVTILFAVIGFSHWRNRLLHSFVYNVLHTEKSLPYSLYLKKQFFSLKRTSKTFRASHCQPYSY